MGERSEDEVHRPASKRKVSHPKSPQRRAASESSSHAATEELQEMLRKKASQGERNRPALHQVKLETFFGSREQFKDWKRVLLAQKALYNLHEDELSMLIYLSCRGEARDILNQIPMDSMNTEGGYQRVMALLEEAYGSRSDERFESARVAYEQYRRLPGQPVAQYIAQLKRLRSEFLAEDPHTVISDKNFSQKLLARAGLSKRERMDVFYNAGGQYNTKKIEHVLRFRCSHIHEDEGRSKSSGSRPDHHQRQRRGGWPKKSQSTRASSSRYRQTYQADDGYGDDDEDADEEDLEQEMPGSYWGDWDDEPDPGYGDREYDDQWNDWYGRNDGYYQDWEEEGSQWYSQESEGQELATAAPRELSEAYAAGWRAKAQASGHKQAEAIAKAEEEAVIGDHV